MSSIATRLETFDLDLISRRYLTRANVSKASRASRYVLFGILFLIVVFTTQFLVECLFSPSEELAAIQETVQKGKTLNGENLSTEDAIREQFTRKDARLIRETKLFGVQAEPASTPAPQNEAPSQEPLPFTLIGTFVNSGRGSQAIIEDTKKRVQEVFGIDEQVFDLAVLKSVHESYVELERDGKIEKLTLEDTETGGGSGGPVPPGAEEIIVDEGELNTALDNLPLLLTQARAVPYFKEGKAVGLRLFAIKSGSLYDKIGLKNGDILKNINGKNLGDFSQAMKLFEQLREERSLTLELERNRKPTTYQYTIQ